MALRTSRKLPAYGWFRRLAASIAAAAALGALTVPAASADFNPLLSTYEMPMVLLQDGTLRSQAPMEYLGTAAVATARFDGNGGVTGTVQVGGFQLPVHGFLGNLISPGTWMARLIVPGGEGINPPIEPKLLDLPRQFDIAAEASEERAAVLGAFVAAGGLPAVTFPPTFETIRATVPVGLGRDYVAEGTVFAGDFVFRGQPYRATAVIGDGLSVSFVGGGLLEAIQVRFDQLVSPEANTVTLNVPNFWLEAWNAGLR